MSRNRSRPSAKKKYKAKDLQLIFNTLKNLSKQNTPESSREIIEYYDSLSANFTQSFKKDRITFGEILLIVAEAMVKIGVYDRVIRFAFDAQVHLPADHVLAQRVFDLMYASLTHNKNNIPSQSLMEHKKPAPPTSSATCKLYLDLGNRLLQKNELFKASLYFQVLSESPFLETFFSELPNNFQAVIINNIYNTVGNTFLNALNYNTTDLITLFTSAIHFLESCSKWNINENAVLHAFLRIRNYLYYAIERPDLAQADLATLENLPDNTDDQIKEFKKVNQLLSAETTEEHLTQVEDYIQMLEKTEPKLLSTRYCSAMEILGELNLRLKKFNSAHHIYMRFVDMLKEHLKNYPRAENIESYYAYYFTALLGCAESNNALQNYEAAIADCNQLIFQSKPVGYTYILRYPEASPPPIIIDDTFLVMQNKGKTLTIHYAQNEKITSKALDAKIVADIIPRLPDEGEKLSDNNLIKEIITKYECAPTKIRAEVFKANKLKSEILHDMLANVLNRKYTKKLSSDAETIETIERIFSLSHMTEIESKLRNPCWIALADAYYNSGNYAKSIQYYTTTIQDLKYVGNDAIMVYLNRGSAYLLNDPKTLTLAIADFNKITNDKRLAALFNSFDTVNVFKAGILQIVDALLPTQQKNSFKTILKLTELLIQSNHLSDKELGQFFYSRAQAYYGLNNPTLALDECNKALTKLDSNTADSLAAETIKKKIEHVLKDDQLRKLKSSPIPDTTLYDASTPKQFPADTKHPDVHLFRGKVKALLESKDTNHAKLKSEAIELTTMANVLLKETPSKEKASIIGKKIEISNFIKKLDQNTIKAAQKEQGAAAHQKKAVARQKTQDEIKSTLVKARTLKSTVESSISDAKDLPPALITEIATTKLTIQQLNQKLLAPFRKINKHKKFQKTFPELINALKIVNEAENLIENALYEKEQKGIDHELQYEMQEIEKSITAIEKDTKSVVDKIHTMKSIINKITSIEDFTATKKAIKHHILEANIVNDNATALLYQANEVGDPNLQQRAKMCVKETEAALLEAKENQNKLYKLKFTDDKETTLIKQTTITSTLTPSPSTEGAPTLTAPIKDEGEQRFQDFFLNQMFPPSSNDNKVTYLEIFSNMKFQTEFEWLTQLRSELAQHGITLILRCSAVPIAINHKLKPEMKGTTQAINDIDFYIPYSEDIDPVLLMRTLREFRFNLKNERPNEFFQNFSCKRKHADGTEITYEITWVTSADYKSTNLSILKRQNMLIKPKSEALGDEKTGSILPINDAFSAVLLFYKNQPELEMLLKTGNYEIDIPDPKDPNLRNFLQRTIKDYEWSQTVLQLKGIGPNASTVLTDYNWIKNFFATKHADTYLKPGCYLEIIALLTSGYLNRTSAALQLKAFLSVVMEAHFNKFFPGVYTAQDLDSAAQNMLPFFQNIFSKNLPNTKDEIASKFYFATKYAIEHSNYFSNSFLPSAIFSDMVRPEYLFRKSFQESARLFTSHVLHMSDFEARFFFEFNNELFSLSASPPPSDQKAQYDSTAADRLLALQMQANFDAKNNPPPDRKSTTLYEELIRASIPITSGSGSAGKSSRTGTLTSSQHFWSSSTSSSSSSQLSHPSKTLIIKPKK